MVVTHDKCDMWMSPGNYGRVDMYAGEQHLALTIVFKSNH